MTDRERQLIRAYLPNPRDESLGDGEYYCKDINDRIQRVKVHTVLPYSKGGMDAVIYGLEYAATGKRFTGSYGTAPWTGEPMANLYDNKQDCVDSTHMLYDGWERLRKLQEDGHEAG